MRIILIMGACLVATVFIAGMYIVPIRWLLEIGK